MTHKPEESEDLFLIYLSQFLENNERNPPNNKKIAEILRSDNPISRNERFMLAELLDPTFTYSFFNWKLVAQFTGSRQKAEKKGAQFDAWRRAKRLKGNTAAAVDYLAHDKAAPKLPYRSERNIYSLAKSVRAADESQKDVKIFVKDLLDRFASEFSFLVADLKKNWRERFASREKNQ